MGATSNIYTDDVTDGMHSPQSLGIALTFSEATNNEYVCEANSLASSAIYYSGILLGALAAIPGFDWAAAAGAFISSVDAGTKAAIKAISLTCEIQTLTGGG
ncbi:hypothetical protein LTR97_012394 [Elasticomyces elasticus]|uniref:Uncharacterized protein n=1 Tax=Elasticomyces elasticus TaxID=574655 RepID=A0AAN7VLZ4_9PEZI|nr:hypothetical protein LTR97_012394 [Elasticomyces elasticus]